MDTSTLLLETQDGSHSLFSNKFGVSYHSKYGAIQESNHVFIKHGLNLKLPTSSHLKILEMGFGSGLNALLSIQSLIGTTTSVEYHTYEAYPISAEQATSLNFPEFIGQAEETKRQQHIMHTCDWGVLTPVTPQFRIKKYAERLEEADLEDGFDLVYFDAFAPTTQPELWEIRTLEKIYQAMAEQGIFVTYCAKGVVKRTLKQLGMTVQSPPGPPGKREMTRAIKGHSPMS